MSFYDLKKKKNKTKHSRISGPGSAPNEFVALAMPNQEINVEWASPDAVNGKVTHYIVHYGEISEGWGWLHFS